MQWTNKNNSLFRVFKFENFKTAFRFMQEVADLAELLNHHPTWTNTYNIVSVSLSTHDAGNSITEKDHELAKGIDDIYMKYES